MMLNQINLENTQYKYTVINQLELKQKKYIEIKS